MSPAPEASPPAAGSTRMEPIPQSEVLTIGSNEGMSWDRFHELTHSELGRSTRRREPLHAATTKGCAFSGVGRLASANLPFAVSQTDCGLGVPN